MRRLGLLELIAGGYATQILLQLSRSPIAGELHHWQSCRRIAQRYRLDHKRLQQILEFLSYTSEAVCKVGGSFRWKTSMMFPGMRFHLEKFGAAYSNAVSHCFGEQKGAQRGRQWVDFDALANAFAAVEENVNEEVLNLIERENVSCLLDLGCGMGALLRELAKRHKHFVGIGVDDNEAMCRRARRATRHAGIGRRVRIVSGQAPAVLRLLDDKERDCVQALHGASFLNEFFNRGSDRAVQVLKELGRLFPGRRAWFVDYHGWLGTGKAGVPPLVNLLQDVAQIASGQGVPPPDTQSWRRVYQGAGCSVVSQRVFRTHDAEWCLHNVRLPKK